MNRVLKLQRLALDESISALGNSCSSSVSSCCNNNAEDPKLQR